MIDRHRGRGGAQPGMPVSQLEWEGSLKLGIGVPGLPKCSTKCYTFLVFTDRIYSSLSGLVLTTLYTHFTRKMLKI